MARKIYEKSREEWKNDESGNTPVMAENLNHIEDGVKTVSQNMALKEIYDDNAINFGRKANTKVGTRSVAYGEDVEASGAYSQAFGYGTEASAFASHAEGRQTKAQGDYSHAEGFSNTASGDNSHAEGANTTASNQQSHAEGLSTTASGGTSHAEGIQTIASELGSHSEGIQTEASGQASHAEGMGTKASSAAQHVQGRYNVEDAENKYAHIVGGGTSNSDRKNIHTLDWQGNAEFAGNVTDGNGTSINSLLIKLEALEGKVKKLEQQSGGGDDSGGDVDIVSWADGTDAQIAAMAQALRDGTINIEETGWEVGQERTVQLSAINSTYLGNHVEQTQTLVILHKGGKLLENGNECSFVIGLKNSLANGTSLEGLGMNTSNTNAGGWGNSRLRIGCNMDFLSMLPEDLRPAFAKFKNATAPGGTTYSGIEETIDLFAFPAEGEIFDVRVNSYPDEFDACEQFEYYKINENRIKKAGDNGVTGQYWWSRSPWYEDNKQNTSFCVVNPTGGTGHYQATTSTVGLAPFGCI